MFSIIKTELYKIRKKNSLKVLIIFLSIFVIGNATYQYFQETKNNNNWKVELIKQNELNQKELEKAKSNSDYPKSFVTSIEKEIKKNEYKLSHNINPNESTSWEFMSFTSTFSLIILMFTLVLASESISIERSFGTLQLILIRPYERWKIYLGKLTSIVIIGFLLICYLLLLSSSLGFLLFGTEGYDKLKMVEITNNLTTIPVYKMLFIKYISYCFTMCIFIVFSFSISILIKSHIFSIILSISLLIGGATITAMLRSFSWAKYLYFTNLDLSIYSGDLSASINGATLEFTIIKYILYSLLLITLSLTAFYKKA